MSRSKQPLRSDKPSIKYKCTLLDGASFELATFDDHTPTSSGSTEQKERKSEANSSQILSTAELISAVGQIWNWANGPLPFLQPKTNLRHYADDSPEGHIFCYSRGKGNGTSSTSSEIPYFPGSLMTTGHALPIVHPKIEFLNVSKKISFFEAHNGNFTHSLFGSLMQHGSNSVTNFPKEFWKEKSPATLGFSYDSRNLYEWMSEVSLPALTKRLNSTMVKNKMTDECCLSGDNPTSCCNLDNTSTPANNLAIGSAQSHAEITKCMDSSSDQSSTAVENASTTSLCSVYYLETVQTIEARSNNLKIPVPRVHTDYYLKNLASDNLTYEECQQKNEDANPYENKKNSHSEFIAVGKSELEVCSPTNTKPHYGLAKQEHAFAGALAGIFVSLCLHPVDTVKTVIQSCAAERPINSIVRSIISERGVTGLYRGIASNIASSAPISAVYTFTYESVKGALLPLFPIEYRSFAHCMGGGCASIATSFIFTPSERIKQQMQVGSHYQNCWKAVVGVIRKGGLPSLYAGWGAVLCRNVPHSVIKFYTYESLKQLMLQSLSPNAQLNTLQTLVCGGLAGSTAALFTTPFDVVKTRLQTQIPGSIHQYDGVLNTLVEISKHEGLKGLYRGLIPRLVMYMSQGAIFFASYESFKRLFCMEVPQIYARTIELVQNMEDEEAS